MNFCSYKTTIWANTAEIKLIIIDLCLYYVYNVPGFVVRPLIC